MQRAIRAFVVLGLLLFAAVAFVHWFGTLHGLGLAAALYVLMPYRYSGAAVDRGRP